jgi:triacylglycerol lipase
MTPRDYALLAQEAYTAAPDIGVADSASRIILRDTAVGQVVTYRGSDDAMSFIHDADATPVSTPLGMVHSGFWSAFLVTRDELMAAITGRPTISGHSLGASLATILAGWLTLNGVPPKAVYAFEPARISYDSTIGDLFKIHGVPVFLYKNGNDLVPDVPPMGLHPAPLICIGTALHAFPNVDDHMLDRVIAALA